MKPLRVAGTTAARRFVKLAIVIALVPAAAGCQRPQVTSRVPAGYQPIAGGPVNFTFPHKGSNLPIEVRVDASPAGSVGFDVYTDQQWREVSAASGAVNPIGAGVAIPDEPGALAWQGSSPDAGMYHVQVFPLAQPASFKIGVAGPGAGGSTLGGTNAAPTVAAGEQASSAQPSELSLDPPPVAPPLQPTRARVAAADTAKATRQPAAAHLAPGKTEAKDAPAAAGKPPQQELAQTGIGHFNAISDQAMEFVYDYPGGNQPVNVIVEAKPAGSVGFSVYTDQQWTLFGSGDLAIPPIGKGTVNPNEPGSLFWRGTSASPGLYHIRVSRLTEPASFWIALAGPGATELSARSPAVPEP